MEARATRQVRLADIHGLDRLVADGWVIRRTLENVAGPFFELAGGDNDDFVPCPPPQAPGLVHKETPISVGHDLT
jgi:hypothetical protein